MRQWRLIYDKPAIGKWNMAVDETIMEAVGAGQVPATLRFYGWAPPCLSIGYGQRCADVDLDQTRRLGWDVVRRPTGGRAILHTDEMTYSLSLAADDDLAAGTVVESYQRISTALLTGLTGLGTQPEADKRAERVEIGAVCFETPSHYEITVNGRKLVGSAQLRRRNAILQHGSLPLSGDIARICSGLTFADDESLAAAQQQVRERAITLEEALGRRVDWAEAAEHIVWGFEQAFEVDFAQYEHYLTEPEYARATQLMTEVYGADEWTQRR